MDGNYQDSILIFSSINPKSPVWSKCEYRNDHRGAQENAWNSFICHYNCVLYTHLKTRHKDQYAKELERKIISYNFMVRGITNDITHLQYYTVKRDKFRLWKLMTEFLI